MVVNRHRSLSAFLFDIAMERTDRMAGAGSDPAGDADAPASPRLLPPQPIHAPATAAVIAVGLSLGAVFFLSDGRVPADRAPDGVAAPGSVTTLAADQAPGAFTILHSSFQNAPGSVLAQLNMPEADKRRLAEKLADGKVRLAAVTLWDTVDEDGDAVDVSAAGFTQRLVIRHKPATFFLPVQLGGTVSITAVRDGGGGVTLGVRTIAGPVPLPTLVVGQTVEIPVL
jgi:hypothetical protein